MAFRQCFFKGHFSYGKWPFKILFTGTVLVLGASCINFLKTHLLVQFWSWELSVSNNWRSKNGRNFVCNRGAIYTRRFLKKPPGAATTQKGAKLRAQNPSLYKIRAQTLYRAGV